MTTSPKTPSAVNFPLPNSPANHTPKDTHSPRPSPTGSPANDFRRPLGDPENPPPPPLPSPHELLWSPSHPCYPHPNPHVPYNDPRRETTRVIRVQRDYSEAGDLYPQFSDTYPEILQQWVSESEFRLLVTTLNAASRKAFNPLSVRAFVDTCLGLMTGWLWEDLGFSGGRLGARHCEGVVSEWNREWQRNRTARRAGLPGDEKGVAQDQLVMCVSLQRTAWMCLDFVIPDPKVAVVREDRALTEYDRSRRITPRASGERIRAELDREREDRERKSREPSRKSSIADAALPPRSAGRPARPTVDTSVGAKPEQSGGLPSAGPHSATAPKSSTPKTVTPKMVTPKATTPAATTPKAGTPKPRPSGEISATSAKPRPSGELGARDENPFPNGDETTREPELEEVSVAA